MVKVNGADRDIAGNTILKCLEDSGFDPRLIAVERNEEIVPKELFDVTVIKDGDVIEIVSYVGGGC